MFKSSASFQSSIFGSFAYQKILDRHQDHLLVRLDGAVDLSFIVPMVEECYSSLGRPAYHPLVMTKLLILQTLYDLSEREVVEHADTNLLFRAFLGLSLDDEVPHWTLLGKFKERLGTERFEVLFNEVVRLAAEVGLLDEKLRVIDSTKIAAKVDIVRHLGAETLQGAPRATRLQDGSPDPDAAIGHKTARSSWYGYKSHVLADPSSGVVTALQTTPANTADVTLLVPLVEKELAVFPAAARPFRRLTGDKAYVGRTEELRDHRILDHVIPRKNMVQKQGTWFVSSKRKRPAVERLFADGKNNHHLGKCRYWTRWKTHLQGVLVYLVMNLKRIVNFVNPALASF